jgi:hypothetical protein
VRQQAEIEHEAQYEQGGDQADILSRRRTVAMMRGVSWALAI